MAEKSYRALSNVLTAKGIVAPGETFKMEGNEGDSLVALGAAEAMAVEKQEPKEQLKEQLKDPAKGPAKDPVK